MYLPKLLSSFSLFLVTLSFAKIPTWPPKIKCHTQGKTTLVVYKKNRFFIKSDLFNEDYFSIPLTDPKAKGSIQALATVEDYFVKVEINNLSRLSILDDFISIEDSQGRGITYSLNCERL